MALQAKSTSPSDDLVLKINDRLNGLYVRLLTHQGATGNQSAVTLNDDAGQVRILTIGTARECWFALDGMNEALDITNR